MNDEIINNDIRNYLSGYKSDVYVPEIKDKIISYMSSKYPFIKNINVSFNSITGSMKIGGKPVNSIGYIDYGDKKLYILDDGSISNLSYNSDTGLMRVVCAQGYNLSNDDINFIKKVINNKNNFNGNLFVSFDAAGRYLNIDDVSVMWGSSDYFDDKLKKIKYIISDAKGKVNGPISIDLRYFEYGKATVSPK
jgi:hypothetical protein